MVAIIGLKTQFDPMESASEAVDSLWYRMMPNL